MRLSAFDGQSKAVGMGYIPDRCTVRKSPERLRRALSDAKSCSDDFRLGDGHVGYCMAYSMGAPTVKEE